MSDKLPSKRQDRILAVLKTGQWMTPSQIAKGLSENISSATLRRDITDLLEHGLVVKKGYKKDAAYRLSEHGILFYPYEPGNYYLLEDDERGARESYNFELLPLLARVNLFNDDETILLEEATAQFHLNANGMSPALHRKELERFVIEFAWKSSKIEGNTYTLLDTEMLLRDGIAAEGKSKFETMMIINHKEAYMFAADSARDDVKIDVAYVEHVHHLLTQGLGVDQGVRNRVVGISGSVYRPLSVQQQLREQLGVLMDVIGTIESTYAKALLAVLGLSYLQPFEDGNKRTARLLANSLLLRAHCAPLSYRSVSEKDYKEATLIFYEQNSIVPFKQLFIDQYIYSATHYNISNWLGVGTKSAK
jgi:Fic family protein